MLTRVLIVLLLILNLGVGLWWWLATPADNKPNPQPQGVPVLELAQVQVQDTSAPVAARPMPIDTPAPQGSGECYVFGPFELAWPMTEASALAAGTIHQQVRDEDEPVQQWRVVMPPMATLELAQQLQQRLVQAGFSDQVLVRNPPETETIALGVFASRQSAEQHIQALTEAGFYPRLAAGNHEIRPALAFELQQGIRVEQARVALAALRSMPVDCAQLRASGDSVPVQSP